MNDMPEISPRYFNPRPREEGDQNYGIFQRCACHFNPRPREEGDRCDFQLIQS